MSSSCLSFAGPSPCPGVAVAQSGRAPGSGTSTCLSPRLDNNHSLGQLSALFMALFNWEAPPIGIITIPLPRPRHRHRYRHRYRSTGTGTGPTIQVHSLIIFARDVFALGHCCLLLCDAIGPRCLAADKKPQKVRSQMEIKGVVFKSTGGVESAYSL